MRDYSLPLVDIYRGVHENEELSPANQFQNWLRSLNEVYAGVSPAPSLTENAQAIFDVWGKVLPRTLYLETLKGISSRGSQAYKESEMLQELDKHYPISLNLVVDTDETIRSGLAALQVFDDNGDPLRAFDNKRLDCRVGDTLIVKARAKQGAEKIHLLSFEKEEGASLFGPGFPQKEADESWVSAVRFSGEKIYHMAFTIGKSSKQYTWSPTIRAKELQEAKPKGLKNFFRKIGNFWRSLFGKN